MKIRQKLLLENLLQENAVQLQYIAREFSTSEKTIRNDIQEINCYLTQQRLPCRLEIKKSIAQIECAPEYRESVSQATALSDYYLYRLAARERVSVILAYLLSSTRFITIANLADKLFVSRGTVQSDLFSVKEWCQKEAVNILLKKKNGIFIDAPPEKKHRLLVQVLKEVGGIAHNGRAVCRNGEFYAQFFSGVDFHTIRRILVSAEEKFQFTFSDEVYEELVIQIALFLPTPPASTPQCSPNWAVLPDNAHAVTDYIATQIEKQLHIRLPKQAIDCIALYIKSATFHQAENEYDIDLPYVQAAAEQLVLSVGEEIRFDFRINPRLFSALVQHLCGAIFRINHGIAVQNPLKEKWIAEEKVLYTAILQNIHHFDHFTKYPLSDDEIAYILIYFATAKAHQEPPREKKQPKVAILCSTGHGTAQIVLENLKLYFSFSIQYVLAEHQLSALANDHWPDFIISTIPLCSEIPHVQIHPLVRASDVDAIQKELMKLGFSDTRTLARVRKEIVPDVSALARSLVRLARQYRRPEDEQKLRDLARAEIDRPPVLRRKGENRSFMLSEILCEDYIGLGAQAADWKEAVRRGGELLCKSGAVDPPYIEAAIQNVVDSGPYIVMTKGVAIPHASKKFGVHRTAISLTTLQTPVCFGNPDNDPVRYVFTLATTDATSHLKALRDLVALLGDPNFFAAIDTARSPRDIISYIKKFESEKGEEFK